MKHCRYKDRNGVCQNRECLFYSLANFCNYCEAGEDYKASECSNYYEESTIFFGKCASCYRRMPDSQDSCKGICEYFEKREHKW